MVADRGWRELSPGERWQLAASLAEEPQVLLLDEPEGHLDGEGQKVLLEALQAFRGVGLLVSHQQHLLDQVASRILWLDGSAATVYPGGYSAARPLHAQVQAGEQQGLEAIQCSRPVGRTVRVRGGPAPSETLAFLAPGPFSVGPSSLQVSEGLGIERDSRIRLEGANGSGKTSLVAALLESGQLPEHRCFHLPQEVSLEEARAVDVARRRAGCGSGAAPSKRLSFRG